MKNISRAHPSREARRSKRLSRLPVAGNGAEFRFLISGSRVSQLGRFFAGALRRRQAALAVLALCGALVFAPAAPALAAATTTTSPTAPGTPTDPMDPTAPPATTATNKATANANSNVCNIYCDGRDPANAVGDRQAGAVTVSSRNVVLHISDGDDMAWGSIQNGAPGDIVWLDRSFDGGQTWATGSQLGNTTIPSGQNQWRTEMYNVDNPTAYGVGAVRACGEAVTVSTTIVCTQWLRSTVHASTPEAASATALMQYYDPSTGLWDTAVTWQDAQALTSLIDYMQQTGDSYYAYAISQIYYDNDSAQFTDQYIDDTGWWGLAWLRAYQYTGNSVYLQTAEYDDNYMSNYWSASCGGGLWWSTSKSNMNAVENEVYLELSAALHNALPGDATYLNRAEQEWSWFSHSGLINSQNLVNDGLNLSTCQNNGNPTYTYNQGAILAGLAQLSQATGDNSVLATADSIATAATTKLAANGILVDPCEPSNCGDDGYSFKGIFVRDLGEFARATADGAYNTFLSDQASSIVANDTDGDGQSGLHWAGPRDDLGFANQQSAVDALTAQLALPSASTPDISSVSPGASAVAGEQITVAGTGFGSTQGSGYLAFSDSGTNWGAPGNAAAFTIDRWSPTAVTFTVPEPSGSNNAWAVASGTTATITVTAASGQHSNTASLGIAATGPIVAGVSSSLCVDDRSSSTADYNPIQIYTCNNTNAQQWTVTSNNTLQVQGMCMDVDAASTTDGTLVDLYTCNGTGAQVWVSQPGGYLRNPNSGKCLDDPSSSTTPGTQLDIWDCNGGRNQVWALP